MEQTKKITKMKQETKATIAYLAAIIFVIICIALMAVTPAYGQNQTVIKDSKGEVVYIKIKTASGYIVKDKNGVLLYTVVENDTEKRVYDASGRLISVEKKAKKMKTMKDQVTSVEQSKRLIEMGVPADKASMVYVNNADIQSFKAELASSGIDLKELIDDGHEYYPAFTDADLLEKVLPNVIQDAHNTYELTLKAVVGGGWRFCYTPVLAPLEADNIGDEMGDNLIELLCNRIEWIVSNGYKMNI